MIELLGLEYIDNLNMIQRCCDKWHQDSQEGYELDIKKLPKEITLIRFYNSW